MQKNKIGVTAGVAMIALTAGIALYTMDSHLRREQEVAKKEASGEERLRPVGELPFYNPNLPKDTQVEAINTVSDFIQKARDSSLLINYTAFRAKWILSGFLDQIKIDADSAYFMVVLDKDHRKFVTSMQKIGNDANGIPLDAWQVAGSQNIEYAKVLSDTNRYPIRSGVDGQTKENVMKLVQSLGFMEQGYMFEHAWQLQIGEYRLPFAEYWFLRDDYRYHMPGEQNIPRVKVVVRIGGGDLNAGQAELVDYNEVFKFRYAPKRDSKRADISTLGIPIIRK